MLPIDRILYIHAGRCSVYAWQRGCFVHVTTLSEHDDGPARLKEILAAAPDLVTALLVDIVEEEHYRDTLPKLNRFDQQALLKRRIRRSYSKTPFRNGAILKQSTGDPETVAVRLSGITRPDAVRVWLSVADALTVPIVGIYSPTVLTERLFKALAPPDAEVTLISTMQSDGRIRHTCFQGSCLVGSRRFRGREGETGAASDFMLTQLESSLRLFIAPGMMSRGGQPAVILVDNAGGESEPVPVEAPGHNARITVIGQPALARQLKIPLEDGPPCGETLFIGQLRRRPSGGDFSKDRHRRYGTWRNWRSLAKAAVWAIAAIAVGSAVLNSGRSFQYQANASALTEQARRLTEAEQHTSSGFAVDPLAMRASVTSYRGLQANRLEPRQFLAVASTALRGHPQIRLDAIEWQVHQAEPVVEYDEFGEEILSDELPERRLVMRLGGGVEPFEGDYAQAFASVASFEQSLQAMPAVKTVKTIRMPIDVSPRSSVEGEVSRRRQDFDALFEFEVTLEPTDGRG